MRRQYTLKPILMIENIFAGFISGVESETDEKDVRKMK